MKSECSSWRIGLDRWLFGSSKEVKGGEGPELGGRHSIDGAVALKLPLEGPGLQGVDLAGGDERNPEGRARITEVARLA